MTIALGIDTGGTYTDAVLVDHVSGEVLAGDKALTTRHDLAVGIGQAVAAVFEGNGVSPAEVGLVALSTTLATNAIVEGRGGPVCLLLVGYDPELIRQYGFERDLVTPDVVYLRGGHDGLGDEIEPLDEVAARDAILARCDHVESFAVSGYFGVRNPAHELRVRALVEELTGPSTSSGQGLPVTCGHELTTRLNAIRRATTTALNARLIPLLQELIGDVRRALDEWAIAAPLMVVKGDGSLVRAEWAMRRPIETILSGPAASVVGAQYLAGRGDVWVVDVGGTTTDIAVLHDGRPRLNPEGARVGEWQTMIEAVDVYTVGLGGDSQVRLDSAGQLFIGPRRVAPLCMLASEYPDVTAELRRHVESGREDNLAGQFALAQRASSCSLPDAERALLDHLTGSAKSLAGSARPLAGSARPLTGSARPLTGSARSLTAAVPQSLLSLASKLRYRSFVERRVAALETRGLVLRAGFTPTDALHVLGRFEQWDAEASRLGAELLAARMGLSPTEFCERVVASVSDRVARELISKVLNDEAVLPDWEQEPAAAALLARALGDAPHSDLGCRLKLRQPLVAVGAPVEAYLPRTAQQLHTELVIPRRAEVGNAVGAVAGGVVQQLRALVRPLEAERRFRLHLPDGVRDFDVLEEAVVHAQRVAPEQVRAQARQAGAEHVEVQVERVDRNAPVRMGWGADVYLGTDLTFTAVGRPSPARSYRAPAEEPVPG